MLLNLLDARRREAHRLVAPDAVVVRPDPPQAVLELEFEFVLEFVLSV